MRRLDWHGLPIVVENEPGSRRAWSGGETVMRYPYGYFAEHQGSDGDELDCYIGPDTDASSVYVVHQLLAPDFKRHDEDKVMLDFASADLARAAYLQHRDDGDRAMGGMTEMPVDRFLAKLRRRTGDGKIRHSVITFTPEIAARLGMRSGAPSMGRLHRFDVGESDGRIQVGRWDRVATFGEGPDGVKVKGGDEVNFTPETFTAMVENWYKRGGPLPLCLDHTSALGGQVRAPAAAFYDAACVVYRGQTVTLRKLAGSTATPPNLERLTEQVQRFATDENPQPTPDGLWFYRAEITPLGEHPTEGLRNYRGLSPFFIMDGTDEQERPIGPVIFDTAAVNVQFQAGCELTMSALSAPAAQGVTMAEYGPWGSGYEVGDRVDAGLPGGGNSQGFVIKIERTNGGSRLVTIRGRSGDFQAHGDQVRKAAMSAAPSGNGAIKMAIKVGDSVRDTSENDDGRVTAVNGGEITIKWNHGGQGKYPRDEWPNERSGTSSDPHTFSRTGAARRMGASMDPEMMKKFGLADGAGPDDKVAKFKSACMDAMPDERKAMAASLDEHPEHEGAKGLSAMLKRMDAMPEPAPAAMAAVEPDKDDKDKEPEKMADDAEKKVMAATLKTAMGRLATLEAAEAERTKAAQAEIDAQINALADGAVKGGYPAEDRPALVTFARTNYKAAHAAVKHLLPKETGAPAHLFGRVTSGGKPIGAPAEHYAAAPKGPRVIRGGGIDVLISDDDSAEAIAQMAASKDPVVMGKIDAMLAPNERAQMWCRLAAAGKIAEKEQPHIFEAERNRAILMGQVG